jgi:hypothetical protein
MTRHPRCSGRIAEHPEVIHFTAALASGSSFFTPRSPTNLRFDGFATTTIAFRFPAGAQPHWPRICRWKETEANRRIAQE